MAGFEKLQSAVRGTTLTGVNKTLLGAQGALVMGIFLFFNTTYSVFGNNFAAWGKYLVFPGFMATELLMAGIATYWYLKARRQLNADESMKGPEKFEKLLKMDIRLSAIWIKTGLILLSGLAGLGVIPGAAAFSAPLMIAGLALYAMVALAIDIHDIRQGARKNIQQTNESTLSSYGKEIHKKRLDLIGAFLLMTVVSCVMVANYIPELVFQIPGMSPVSVLMGVLAGAGTMGMAYSMPSEPIAPVGGKLTLVHSANSNMMPPSVKKREYDDHIDSNLVAWRLNGHSATGTHTKQPSIVRKKGMREFTEAELAEMSDEKKKLFGLSNTDLSPRQGLSDHLINRQ